jgi:hypothetical protein
MNLDIRYPIGLLFVIIGGILAGCGLFLQPAGSAGPNVDLTWGLLQVAFGATMLALARRGARKKGGAP